MLSETTNLRHGDLGRIASLVTVRDIFSPFIASFDAASAVSEVWEQWETDLCENECPLNHMALVMRDHKPVGLLSFEALDADKKTVGECMNEIRIDALITEDTSLIHAAEMFANSATHFFVVIKGNEIVGWMSYHDLYKLPFRLCLFASLLAVEEKMLQVSQQNPHLAFETLPDGRKIAARRVYEMRGFARGTHAREETSLLLTCTTFIDKATILKRCPETKRLIPAACEKEWMLLAEKVRNSLAHANPDEQLFVIVEREKFGGFLMWLARLETELMSFLTNAASTLD